MTDTVIHLTGRAAGLRSRVAALATRLVQSLRRAALTERTCRELSGLPDEILRDVGITRGEIPYLSALVAHDELFMRDLTEIRLRQDTRTTSLCGRNCSKCTPAPLTQARLAEAA